MNVKIEPTWKKTLQPEFNKPYFQELATFIKQEYKQQTIYPPAGKIFSAFNQTPITQVKVVILGQDPYHGPNQAHGLCFSVQPPTPPPPSLINIYKEIKSDIGKLNNTTGDLHHWTTQGIFLLNTTLTVRAHQPASHQKHGWETFTDAVIKILSSKKKHLVFILWGRHAQTKSNLIDTDKHLILKSAHPSPLSAHRGFFGSRPFSKTNQYLLKHKKTPINW